MKTAYNISSITETDFDNSSAIYEDLISQHAPMAHYLFGWVSASSCNSETTAALVHDIKLADGGVIDSVFPSGNVWVSLSDSEQRYPFTDVVFVRISKKQPLMSKPYLADDVTDV
ncbi:MAG: hypothetical protein GY833_22330 [Aestuariibacter sp.]|nr:hypothetical protein [Aestuariibacter sp.]